MHTQLREYLLNENIFDVPSYSVELESKRQFEEFKRQYGNHLKYEESKYIFSGIAERNVRWAYIVEKISEKENITVEDFDFDEYIAKLGEDIANDAQICERIRKSENIKQSLLNQKVLDFLLDFAVTTEMPYEDFIKMQQMKQEEMLKHIKDVPHHHHDHNHEEFDNVYDDEVNTFDYEENGDEEVTIEEDVQEEDIQEENNEDK